MAVTELADALGNLSAPAYHYQAPQQKKPPYIVWGETSVSREVDADDEAEIVMVRGELWYYTGEKLDKTVNEIIDALESAGAVWSIDNIGRDNATHMIVYGMKWGIPCGGSEIY